MAKFLAFGQKSKVTKEVDFWVSLGDWSNNFLELGIFALAGIKFNFSRVRKLVAKNSRFLQIFCRNATFFARVI